MKAILRNGAILPREPLPKEWTEGTELEVAMAPVDGRSSNDELDRWIASVQASADQMDPEDEIILEKAIREARDQARALARNEAEKS